MTQYKQLRDICFTSFDTNIEWFKDWTKVNKSIVKYIIIQGELTKEGKKHIQGFAQFTGQKRIEQIKKFFGDNTLHIEKTQGTPQQASQYCKELKNGVFKEYEEYGEMTEKQQGKRNDLIEIKEMLKDGMTLQQISMNTEDETILSNICRYNRPLKELEFNIRQERFKDEIKRQFENIKWRPFQQKIIDELENIADNRKIKWIYDDLGNTGKSFLARYLMTKQDIYYITGGKQNDILYGYNGQKIIIYDLARTYADNLEHIYTTIENFKNGQYLSTKYETQQRIFAIPHIIVMANFKPDETKLSKDRWDIVEVNKEEQHTVDIVEITEVKKKLKAIKKPIANDIYYEKYKYIEELDKFMNIINRTFITLIDDNDND